MSSSDLCWPQSSEDSRNWAPDRFGKRSQTRKTSTMSAERSSRSPPWAPAALSPWQRWYSLFNYVDQHSSHSEPWTNKKMNWLGLTWKLCRYGFALGGDGTGWFILLDLFLDRHIGEVSFLHPRLEDPSAVRVKFNLIFSPGPFTIST